MLVFKFSETSQNFSSFRQLLFFIVSKGEQRKNVEKLPKLYIGFRGFFPLVPPWKLWKIKVFKRTEILWGFRKSSICWKFQLSISLGSKKSPSTIQPGVMLNKPFYYPLCLVKIFLGRTCKVHKCAMDITT